MTHTKHRKRRERAARELMLPDLMPWQRMVLDHYIVRGKALEYPQHTRQQHREHAHLTAEQLHAMGWRKGGLVEEHEAQCIGVWMAPLDTPPPRRFP